MPDVQQPSAEQEIADLRRQVFELRQGQEQLKHKQEGPDDKNDQKGEKDDEKQEGDGKEKEGDKKEEPQKPHPLRTLLILVVAVVVVVAAVIWWLDARKFESTDDAFVDGHTSAASARVAGTVVGAYFEENQTVKAGDLLADLDPRDYQVALTQAKGQFSQAVAQQQAEQPNVPVTRVTSNVNISTASSSLVGAQAGVEAAQRNLESALAKVDEAEANNVKAQTDVERYRPLAEKDEIPHEQFDQVVANAKALQASVAAARSAAEAARKQVDQSREQVVQARAHEQEAQENAPSQVAIRQYNVAVRRAAAEAARAQLEQNQLNLSYAKIYAPVSGIIVKRSVEVGQHLTPGQQIFLISQIDDLWVTANFKETQLRRMREKQSVRIHVDALEQDFDGYVESLASASGAVTSLLPPENATGNFVKVVQRLPVRIRFKKGQEGLNRLRPGMSVEPKTRVQ